MTKPTLKERIDKYNGLMESMKMDEVKIDQINRRRSLVKTVSKMLRDIYDDYTYSLEEQLCSKEPASEPASEPVSEPVSE